jgi:hypothetical protein
MASDGIENHETGNFYDESGLLMFYPSHIERLLLMLMASGLRGCHTIH